MIRKLFLGLVFLLLPALALAQPPRLTGIAPSVARPGSRVIVTGGPFTQEVRVLFGDRLLTPDSLAEKQLTFVVPNFPAGEYLLQLQEGEETSDRSIFFRVVLPPPAILSVDPQQIDTCDRGRQVMVSGEGFQPGTRLLLDGAILATERTGEDTLAFAVPQLAPGLHQIQLANPDDQKSLPAALLINNIPEIVSVATGEEAVTYYQLLIYGKNFSYKSILLVNGQQIGAFEGSLTDGSLTAGGQEYIPYNLDQPARDSLQYVDCRTLIYIRHPVTTQPKTFTLQVINPDGKASEVYSHTGP